jgi:hypothetical protein
VTFSGSSPTAIYRGKAIKNKELIPIHTGPQIFITVDKEYSLVKTIMTVTDHDNIITAANIPDMVLSFFMIIVMFGFVGSSRMEELNK